LAPGCINPPAGKFPISPSLTKKWPSCFRFCSFLLTLVPNGTFVFPLPWNIFFVGTSTVPVCVHCIFFSIVSRFEPVFVLPFFRASQWEHPQLVALCLRANLITFFDRTHIEFFDPFFLVLNLFARAKLPFPPFYFCPFPGSLNYSVLYSDHPMPTYWLLLPSFFFFFFFNDYFLSTRFFFPQRFYPGVTHFLLLCGPSFLTSPTLSSTVGGSF